ncbi:MAG: AMP-binding protein, partial [Halioglobus sp.]|nr:AMP-binding protein [Halioglobus sp.]
LVGAEVVIAGPRQVMDTDYLIQRLSSQHSEPETIMQATPASWQLLLQSGWRRRHDLTVLCGGEALSESLARNLMDTAQDGSVERGAAPLINCYGPTETSVWSSLHDVVPESPTAIGRPLRNNVLKVLDTQGRLQPIGVAGELWIGGAGVARGYYQQPDLTADRFRDIGGEMFYGTGDLAVLGHDGLYHCLGRLDQQIKIRGFRVEPGEIETAMLALVNVAQACVVIKYCNANGEGWLDDPAPDADPRLVAYWVGEGSSSQTLAWAQIQAALRLTLPEYMVPAHGVELEALPLTPSGKVNRRGLPSPQVDAKSDNACLRDWRASTDVLGRDVYQAFADTLSLDNFSPHAHFFDVGGHSLLAMQAVARLQRVAASHGLDGIDIQSFFASATVAGVRETLAAGDSRCVDENRELLAPPLLTSGMDQTSAPMSFAQQRLWALTQLQGGASAAYNMASAVRLDGKIDLDKLAMAFDAVVQRQTALRTRLIDDELGIRQEVCEASGFELQRRYVEGIAQSERDTVLQQCFHEFRQQVFTLDSGCLLRAQALVFIDEVVVVLSVHHVAFDAWSAGILLSEVAESYLKQLSGESAALAPLDIHYADYATWQRAYLKGQYLEQRLDFWRQALAGAPESLKLPFDRPQPHGDAIGAYAGDELHIFLNEDSLLQIKALASSSGCTLFMVLSAVYYLVLRAFTGNEDVLFGTDVANRPDTALESIVGFFVNVVPLRFREPDHLSFEMLLSVVRAHLVEVYKYQDVPFDLLVEELGAKADGDSNPLVQSLLVLQNTPFNSPEDGKWAGTLAAPAMSILDLDNQISRFDLSLFAAETQDGLSLTWKYRKSRYARNDVIGLAQAYESILRKALLAPQLTVRDLCDLVVRDVNASRFSKDRAARRRIGRSSPQSLSSGGGGGVRAGK